MNEMNYIIYKNISESEFFALKERLDSIERINSPLMQMEGFYLNRRNYEESLSLDYVSERKDFMGNIGVAYDEAESKKEEKLFRFYFLKAYDFNNERFFKKGSLEKLYPIKGVEDNFMSLFRRCILLYNSITREDMTESIKLK
jgi:hypothetical protein